MTLCVPVSAIPGLFCCFEHSSLDLRRRNLTGIPTRSYLMHFANRTLRAVILTLASVGLIVPAWAAQPCRCGEDHGCCSRKNPDTASCREELPCCTADVARPTCDEVHSVGCPCCTTAPEPTSPAQQQQPEITQQHQSPFSLAFVPAIAPPLVATSYVDREFESPPGHPALRLHALYRVWLN